MSAVPSAAGGVHLRALAPDDLDACHSLSAAVGWAHRREDWTLVLGLGQGLAAIAEGELVGTAMWWAFGLGHASLGSIIVAPDDIPKVYTMAELMALPDAESLLSATVRWFEERYTATPE